MTAKAQETKTGKMSLTNKILIGMLLGVITGVLLNFYLPDPVAGQKDACIGNDSFACGFLINGLFLIVGKVFVSLLKFLVVPIVFTSLICGVMGLDLQTLGRTGGKALGLFLMTTAIAITIGMTLATTFNIGSNTDQPISSYQAKEAPALSQVFIDLFPSNLVHEMAEGNMLPLIIACMFIGVAITRAGESGKKVGSFIEKLNDVVMELVHLVMALAPYAVFFLVAKVCALQGVDTIVKMGGYFFTVVAALFIHAICTYGTIITLARLSPRKFFRKMRSVQLFAFSTASSNATIPVTLDAAEHRLGAKNETASFIVPFGATINMDGTAIMQGVATVFIANMYGIDLSMMEYLTVIGMAVLASIGTAGVPGVGLIMLGMVLNQVGLPQEGILLIIGVDRILDMLRTAVNVTGDAAITCVVSKSEGKLDETIFNDPEAGKIVD